MRSGGYKRHIEKKKKNRFNPTSLIFVKILSHPDHTRRAESGATCCRNFPPLIQGASSERSPSSKNVQSCRDDTERVIFFFQNIESSLSRHGRHYTAVVTLQYLNLNCPF